MYKGFINDVMNARDTTFLYIVESTWKSSIMTPREALGLPELPPVAHEMVAIMQFGTSYELVEWLAQRL